MGKNIFFYLQVLVLLYLELLVNLVDAQCTYLTARDYDQTLESHSGYGDYDYSNYENECWVIEADDYDKSVQVETDGFDLESDHVCGFDYLKLRDGDSDSYSYDFVKYCGHGDFEITSSGSEIYLKFYTDGATTREGFRLKYRQVDSDEHDSDDWDNTYHNLTSGLIWWVIFLIVVGVIIFVIIAIVVIIIVVVVCILKGTKSSGRVMNGNGRHGGNMVVQNGQTSYMGGTVVQPPAYGQPGTHPPAYNQTAFSQGGMGMTTMQQQQQYQKSPYPQPLAVNPQQGTASYQQQPAPMPQMNYNADSTNSNDIPPPPVYSNATQQ